jgi:hypothetical protein
MRFSGAEKIASTLKKKQEKMKQARHSPWMKYLVKSFDNLGYGMGMNVKNFGI